MADIVHEVMLAAEPEKVFSALSEEAGLASWWTAETTARPEIGSEAEFTFEGGAVVFRMRIDELSAGKRVVWSALASPVPGWEGTKVTWDLTPEDGGTKLLFGHRGWPSIEGAFPSINFAWAAYLQSLKAYVETGKGMPHQPQM